MEWRCVDEEHNKCATGEDPNEVVLVVNYVFPERETEFCLDREDLRNAVDEHKSGDRRDRGLR
jgi:hypothetical protein